MSITRYHLSQEGKLIPHAKGTYVLFTGHQFRLDRENVKCFEALTELHHANLRIKELETILYGIAQEDFKNA